ncbi:prolyl oligopeptidase family serine peptidase [Streptomyces sp. NPDC046909]|uniref:S9 family peptidase n=1 Tax=Streptomyces sp. NPDC046909 TaxID=3155617 RepID=UPI0033D97732
MSSLPEQLVRTDRFSHGVPRRFTLTPDGSTLLFLRSRAGDDPAACLWVLDLDTRSERLLASGGTTGIETYATDRTAGLAAFPLAGALWTVAVRRGEPRRLPAVGPVTDPRPDPTGRRIAYVSRGALRVIDAEGTADRAIAEPPGPDVEFGAAEHTGATSPEGARGHWWSPDGERLLIARTDSSAVPHWPDDRPPGLRLAAAGAANPDVTLWIADLDGASTRVEWDRGAFEYVVGAGWDSHGPFALVQSRDQRTVRFLAVDPAGGTTSLVDERRDDHWVHLVPGLPARTDTGALLSHADLHGTRHLTTDGVPITPAGLQLRAVLGVEGEEVLFTASEEPTETHLWSYRVREKPRRLTSGAAVYSGARRGGTLVCVADRAEVLRDGEPAVSVTSYAETPVLDVHAIPLVLGPRELRARLYLPSWHHRPQGRLPVLLDPYGGAGHQRVTAERDWKSLVSQWFAEHGFAVLVADGRGTPGRGPDWEREVHGDLFGVALDDQVTALREAARRHPELDLGRVGIRGWSYGAGLAAMAVLRRPDVFHAAVAGAGVADQRLFNAHWRERFLGHPDEFPQRYEDSSSLRYAPALSRPLLLMHGSADARVPVANTVRLSAALHAAGRPHEVYLMPGAGHQPWGTPVAVTLLERQVRFLRRHLGVS